MTYRRFVVNGLVVVLALITLAVPIGFRDGAAGAADPRLTLAPDDVRPGRSVRAIGRYFPKQADGSLVWVATGGVLATIRTSAGGTFSARFDAPNVPTGAYAVVAQVGSVSLSATLNVTSPPNPTPDVPQPIAAPTDVPPTPTDVPPAATTTPTPTPPTAPSPTQTATTTATAQAGSTASAAVDSADELVVAGNGSDANAGTVDKPLKTLQKALSLAQPGTTITLRGGTYTTSKTITSARNGTADAPITIRSAPGERAVLAGPSSSRGLQINHDWYVIRDLELTGADILLWLDGAEYVLITGNRFYDAGGECVRIKNQSRNNTFSSNTVVNCGLTGFDLGAGSKNGEGVYVGTAPEQRYKIGGVPDQSTGNVIEYNTFQTNGSEAVDLKEDAEWNVVRYNVGSNNRDPEGANFGTRGDNNQFIGNESFGSAGAGFRAGGDMVDGRLYGKNNVFRGNLSYGNAGYGYKFMVGPQDADCSNTGSNNQGGKLFYFGGTTFAIPCTGSGGGGSVPTPTPTRTPSPSPTRPSWSSWRPETSGSSGAR